jgi:glycosyltransferase involved in cell wall biosynthesis
MRSRNQALRIGLVGPLPPPSGGMAGQTEQLARLLGAAGHGVEVIQVNAPYRPAWVGRFPVVRALFRLIPYLLRLWRSAPRNDLFHVMGNSGWAWHLHAAPAVWIAHVRRRPVVVNYRGGLAESFLAAQARWVRPTLKRASRVIVPSGFLQAVFASYQVPTEVVPNIVDLSRFRPAHRDPGRVHLIVTRNLEAIYDIPTALRAFVRIRAARPDARLTVAGSGPLRHELERLCAELGVADALRFTGRLDHAEMAGLYRSATLLLNPSRVDNMPNSLLEALASGVPIVSTDVGGIPFMVEDGVTAILVPPADPEALARAALRVLGDPELADRLRRAGLAAVQACTWDRVGPRLLEAYESCLGIPRADLRAGAAHAAPERD